MVDFQFACPNCGPATDPLGDSHGCCETCGSELVRLTAHKYPPQEQDRVELRRKDALPVHPRLREGR